MQTVLMLRQDMGMTSAMRKNIKIHWIKTRNLAKKKDPAQFRLDLVHGSDVTRLDVIFNFANLFLKFFNGNLCVLDYNHYLEFADAVSNGNKFVSIPDKSVHFNFLNFLEHVVHVGFIVPRFAIKQDWGLSDKGGFLGFFGSIGVQPFLTNFGSFLTFLFFLIRTEKINVIIVVVSSSGSSSYV